MYRCEGNTETHLRETAYEDMKWFIIGSRDGML